MHTIRHRVRAAKWCSRRWRRRRASSLPRPLELANGYTADRCDEHRARVARDHAVRDTRGAVLPPVDEALLGALADGLPDCSGVALGVDRLLMAMLGSNAIADVLAFDFAHA